MSLLITPPAGSLSEIWRQARTDSPVVKESDHGIHVGYQHAPVRWLVEQLGIPEPTIRWSLNPGYKQHRWDGTRDPLVHALEGLAASEDVGVEAGTGTQKTYVLGAGAMLWFLGCFEDAIVVTLAPKESQLKLHLWKEARVLFPRFKLRFPNARLTDLKLRMRGGLDEKWTATGFVAGVGADEETANKARGFHAEHALYIFEETPGIHAAIGSAIDFTCSAPHNLQLRLGNPDNQQDELHRFCVRQGVRHVRISALDHPNVVSKNPNLVPGATSQKAIDKVKAQYGEGSDTFNAKVRGISPKQASDSVIRWEWLEAAAARYNDPAFRRGTKAMGVDVADSPEGDDYAIARGIGACCLEVSAAKIGQTVEDATDLGEQLGLEIELEGVDEQQVGVDSVGVGAATVNALKKLKYRVRKMNGGLTDETNPKVDQDVLRESDVAMVPVELFDNNRSKWLWQLRQDLMHNRIALPYDEELFQDLTAPKWEKRAGKISVEPKSVPVKGNKGAGKNWGVRNRLGRSTNKGDAVVYWNAVRYRMPEKAEDAPRSAFDPAVLAHEALESRRVRGPKKPKAKINPSELTHVD